MQHETDTETQTYIHRKKLKTHNKNTQLDTIRTQYYPNRLILFLLDPSQYYVRKRDLLLPTE